MKRVLLLASVVFALVAVGKGVQAILNDEPTATQTYYGDGSPKSSTFYVEGVKEGRSEQWRSDGTKEWDGDYKAGLRHGEWLFWREDGSLDSERSGTYFEGKRVDS
jgi:antitoxin component YwqK of YwqJK toxin-antitoxin module